MGVNTQIRLPADVRVDDVAKAVGILAGLKPVKSPLGHRDGYYGCNVPGAEAEPTSLPNCCDILLSGPLIDGEERHTVMFHFEPSGDNPGRLMIPRSTTFWICIARGLVDFFGGSVDYQDCDSIDEDYKARKPRKRNNPEDGQKWQKFQDALLSIEPITKPQLAQAEKWAAYKSREMRAAL